LRGAPERLGARKFAIGEEVEHFVGVTTAIGRQRIAEQIDVLRGDFDRFVLLAFGG
jgi:hypothetical protein